ncbi:sigma 54-interacting transcriptional regulator [Mitsuokella sp.]|uniref:sigma 54-interacting transcriptional regulator n=1 Tax=Mitsuokella TaxID=52225 RepID=UPI002A81C31C|nr:sigma 54-interacting transcriptional regulator [Mitsuokella sp.]MDY4475079.1 sigma 54-interacting transcriptional regulator [Mitsuokella sp.]
MSLILFAAPTEDVGRKAKKIIRRKGLSIPVLVTDDKSVRSAIEAHPETLVVISRGGVAEEIKKVPGKTVVEVTTSFNDILTAVAYLSNKGCHRIAIVMRDNILFDTPQNFSLAHTDVLVRPCRTYEEIEATVRSLVIGKTVDGIAGCRLAIHMAEENGMLNSYVDSSESSIEKAINDALKILDAKKKETLQLEQLQVVVQNIEEGIVVLDEDKQPLFFNDEAKRLFQGDVLNNLPDQMEAYIKEYTGEQLITLGENTALFRMIPICVRDQHENAVLVFHETGSIAKSEQKIRTSMYQKGLYAKKHFSDILTVSPRMKKLLPLAEKFAQTEANVLITGETGTGKEGMAQSIHNASQRSRKPFVSVNCASIPPNLIESELFGYVEGAFTGARRSGKKGLFELADGGTIFLDEIAELPLNIQGRLLRVLQEHEIMRVGDDKIIPLDIRVICATNKNLRDMVDEGKFREDLYYRINVLKINIPPLRERKEDIMMLMQYYFHQFAPRIEFSSWFDNNLKNRLMNYAWPGNIRELRNMAEVFACYADGYGNRIHLDELMDGSRTSSADNIIEIPLGLSLKEIELAVIDRMLEQYTPEETCAKLGISRVTLWRKCRREV